MTNEFKKIDNEELKRTVGGREGKVGLWEGPYRTVHGLQSGWLALRSEPCYDARNEIGHLYNGDRVQIMGNDALTEHDFDKAAYTAYTWVYSPQAEQEWMGEQQIHLIRHSGRVNRRFI